MLTVLFDIDGTLLNAKRAGGHTIDRVLLDVFAIQRVMPLKLHGRTDRGILNELLNYHGHQPSDESFSAFQEAYLPLLDVHIQQNPSEVLPGVFSLLDWLASQENIATGILTGNMKEGANIKLKHSGLADYFHFGGYGDLHPLRDDVAREAKTAAQTFLKDRFCDQRIVVIGDTVADITCAQAIGAQSVAVLTGGANPEELQQHQPTHLLEDLSDSIHIFEAMLNGS